MSSKHRRIKRKIAQLVRMDQTRRRMQGWDERTVRFFYSCMAPLGKKLKRMGFEVRARNALRNDKTDLK